MAQGQISHLNGERAFTIASSYEHYLLQMWLFFYIFPFMSVVASFLSGVGPPSSRWAASYEGLELMVKIDFVNF